jgi:hypothetical protein
MVLTTVLLAATVLQTKEEMDGVDRRRFYEAGEAARLWAKWKTQELYPVRIIANEANPDRRAYLSKEARTCEHILRICAFNHVNEAYKIKPGLLESIMSDWYLAQKYPYTPEKDAAAIHDPNAPAWERKGTLFDPAKVRVPTQYKKRFGYKYPDAHALAKEFNRRSPSQDLKEQLLKPTDSPLKNQPAAKASPPSEGDSIKTPNSSPSPPTAKSRKSGRFLESHFSSGSSRPKRKNPQKDQAD